MSNKSRTIVDHSYFPYFQRNSVATYCSVLILFKLMVRRRQRGPTEASSTNPLASALMLDQSRSRLTHVAALEGPSSTANSPKPRHGFRGFELGSRPWFSPLCISVRVPFVKIEVAEQVFLLLVQTHWKFICRVVAAAMLP